MFNLTHYKLFQGRYFKGLLAQSVNGIKAKKRVVSFSYSSCQAPHRVTVIQHASNYNTTLWKHTRSDLSTASEPSDMKQNLVDKTRELLK